MVMYGYWKGSLNGDSAVMNKYYDELGCLVIDMEYFSCLVAGNVTVNIWFNSSLVGF